MPVALVKAALMSSTAFFIEAAAKAVSVTFCARAGRAASVTTRARVDSEMARPSMAVLRGTGPYLQGSTEPEPPFRSTPARAQRAAVSDGRLARPLPERKAGRCSLVQGDGALH